MEGGNKNLQIKRLYETILSNGIQIQIRKEAVLSLIKMAITDHSNFSFLLNQIDWFCKSNLQLLPLLAKVLRAYRGTSKAASKVVYNMLADGLSLPQANVFVVDILVNLVNTYKDATVAVQYLRQNYPHKLCSGQSHISYLESLISLIEKIPSQRFALLQIIIQNVVAFDTEMTLGETFINAVSLDDQDVLVLSQECGPYQIKYDQILSTILKFFAKFEKKQKEILLKQLYLIFQKKVIQIENIKMIQYLLFYLAQTSTQLSQCFITLLMVSIFQNYNNCKSSKKKFISSLQFLRSYLNRSLKISEKKVRKVFISIISQFKQRLDGVTKVQFQNLNLSQFGQDHICDFYMLETIIFIKQKLKFVANKQNIKEIYLNLLEQAKSKLYFSYFIDKNILKLASLIGNDKQNQKLTNTVSGQTRTIYTQKFIPVFLPECQKLIEMKLNTSEKRLRPNWSAHQSTQVGAINGNILSKKQCHGGQTPLTIQQLSM